MMEFCFELFLFDNAKIKSRSVCEDGDVVRHCSEEDGVKTGTQFDK